MAYKNAEASPEVDSNVEPDAKAPEVVHLDKQKEPKKRAPRPEKRYCATGFPGPDAPLSKEFADAVQALGKAFRLPVWMIVQQQTHKDNPEWALIDWQVSRGFFRERSTIGQHDEILLLIDSPGGYADSAYEIAQLLRRHAGAFTAVVPRYAKSAATLLMLGAKDIYFGMDAEMGPLDAQIFDYERETESSALNEVQALERLHSDALFQVDQTTQFLHGRTGKRVETILPMVMTFVSQLMQPLLQKIDTVHYTGQSRTLKVAEEYAKRLLEEKYGTDGARSIARHLVHRYSTHGFVINVEEAGALLRLPEPTSEQKDAIEALAELLTETRMTVVGTLREVGK